MLSNLTVWLKLLLAVLLSAAVSFFMTPPVKKFAEKVGAIDVPKDGRRVHDHPIPRMGGLAIFLGFVLAVLAFVDMSTPIMGMLIGAVIIAAMGAVDDIVSLNAWVKLGIQILAALVAIRSGIVFDVISNPLVFSDKAFIPIGYLTVPLTVLWIVGCTNAVNLIDGLDGLAVGVATISSLTMLVIAMLVSDSLVALMMAALAGSCIGFLPYNHNPAKIFMGDTGSTFLGFVLATVSIQGLFKFYTIISFAVPFLMLGLPLFDTCFAILRRLSKGQNPMAPDRSHVHHRLIDMGFSQKQAVAILYVISAILGLSAVVLTTSGALKAMVLLCALCLAGLIAARISLSHGGEKTEIEEETTHGTESDDNLRDPSGGSEDGPSGEGAGEPGGN